ncbi:MAG: DUF3798 domain-containing protein [Candidatus Eisenbacteria bacterium]|uniref:DUF3798 domain-containing protein n=1 Tax=Eiseniibacteriota bacterium TaxID=2212470 RepID=A0A7Y2EC33_UNCEI|nr:DUF3798 domain-containing protein [Candidatus Eisenbacteria bacterium]
MKLLRMGLVMACLVGMVSCSGGSEEDLAVDGKLPFKIGIMTGTVSQGEDEYRGAERVIAKYGADRIKHVTYPDNFMVEQETMIAQILNLAADSKVEAIIIAQGVPGSMAAMKKVKELRPDMLFILDNPHEDPHQVAGYADLSLIPDDLRRGETIVELAKNMGATSFVHYSFPRHMSQELLARRKDIMEDHAAKLGMDFVYVNAPDPTGDQGLPGAQKFILEDVPRQISQYGKDTAFFSTNCGMQEPLIRAVMDKGAIFPEQCCPSPTHGYPGALGIAINEEQAGDMAQICEAIQGKVDEYNQQGRMATWPVSIGIVTIETAVDLAIKKVRDDIDITQPAVIRESMQEASGVDVTLVPFEGKDNYYLVLLDSIVF